MPGDQPDAKRQRVGDVFVLQPEEEFLAQFPGGWVTCSLLVIMVMMCGMGNGGRSDV